MIDVTCAIILRENKVLVTQRSERMKLPLKWEFPGGKIEENESDKDCLLREIKEELNLEIELLEKIEPKCFDYETFSIRLIPFVALYVSGEIILAEHKDYKWLEKEELNSLDWALADIPVLEEFLKLNYDTTRTL
ncbi:MAG: CTP pyrophosphohydrolase [Bacteroidia bacterium]|nr:CTP pyrophosphohydrolase [Bacteroidia bacterium]